MHVDTFFLVYKIHITVK